MGLMFHGFVGNLVPMEAGSLGPNMASKNGEWVSWEQHVKSAGNMGNSMA